MTYIIVTGKDTIVGHRYQSYTGALTQAERLFGTDCRTLDGSEHSGRGKPLTATAVSICLRIGVGLKTATLRPPVP